MTGLLAFLAIGQLADGLTLAYIEATSPGLLQYEQNGLVGIVLGFGGAWAVALIKMALVLAVAYIAVRRRRLSTRWTALLGIVACTGFIGAAFNLMAVLS